MLNTTSNFEEFHQIMELTVDVSTDSNWALDSLDIALLGQNLLRFLTQDLDLKRLLVTNCILKEFPKPGFLRAVCNPTIAQSIRRDL